MNSPRFTMDYLLVSAGLLAILVYFFVGMAFTLIDDTFGFLLVCLLASLLYPFALQLLEVGTSFLQGLLTLISALAVALVTLIVVYDLKMNPIHHDASVAFAIWVWYVAAAMILAVILYPIGFWGTRLLRKILP